jgi:hypothetical protein
MEVSVSTKQSIILSLLYWSALSDGDLDPSELEVLRTASELFGAIDAPTNQANHNPGEISLPIVINPTEDQLKKLIAHLTTEDDKQLLVKLVYQLLTCSSRSIDAEKINALEKSAYRKIVSACDLSDESLSEAEWAAKSELDDGDSTSIFFDKLIEKVRNTFSPNGRM